MFLLHLSQFLSLEEHLNCYNRYNCVFREEELTIDISKKSYLKYLLFGSLYFSEGIILALSTVILIIYFTHKDISIATATLVGGIVYIPWVLKFVFGPITDFFIKYGRKPFIIIGGILGAIFLFPLAVIDPKAALIPFTLLLFVSHIFIVFLDVSVDAWAIQISKVHERGKVNAAMCGGLFGGSAFGSSVFAIIASAVGFNMVFITAGLIILLTIIFPLLVTEKKIVKERQKIVSLVITEFKKKKYTPSRTLWIHCCNEFWNVNLYYT